MKNVSGGDFWTARGVLGRSREARWIALRLKKRSSVQTHDSRSQM